MLVSREIHDYIEVIGGNMNIVSEFSQLSDRQLEHLLAAAMQKYSVEQAGADAHLLSLTTAMSLIAMEIVSRQSATVQKGLLEK